MFNIEEELKKRQWVRYVILDYILMKIIKQTIQIDQKLDIEKVVAVSLVVKLNYLMLSVLWEGDNILYLYENMIIKKISNIIIG